MTVDIQTLTNGDTDYIGKHNANYGALKSAVEALQAQSGSAVAQANLTAPLGFEAAFGSASALIGNDSYALTTSGTTLTLSKGFFWDASNKAVVAKSSSTAINFSGLAAATYYIHIDGAGTPAQNTSAADAVYSVVWTGTGFSTLTRLVPVIWAAGEWLAAQTSTALAATYPTLDARLEAGEAQAIAGSAASTIINGKLTKSVAGNAAVTLTAAEAKALYFEFTGVLTGNIQVKFPLASTPRLLNIKNSTTGSFTLECVGSTGNGRIVAQGYSTLMHHDGTNLERANTDAYTVAKTVPYAANITLDWSQYDTAHVTLTGNAVITHTNARPGQKCLLYIAQDGVGNRSVTWGAEVQYGNDIGGIALSTAASKTDEVGFSYNWVSSKYNCVSVARGY